MFDDTTAFDNSKITVLLCISDTSSAEGELPLPLTPLFGRPMIHHTIKALQRIGLKQFYIGIDSVPGALLAYKDTIAKEGLDLRFVREPSAMAALLPAETRALVLCADTIWDANLIDRALRCNVALIATVEERSENQMFERIDLNSRWAGLAIFDRKSLAALTQLPEGWDMASALLRQGLQDNVTLWPLKQSEIQSGHIRRLETAHDLASAQSLLMAPPAHDPITLESKLFSKSLAQFGPMIWSVSCGRGLAEFSFPSLVFITALLAVTGFQLGASVIAIGAVLAAMIRNFARSAEYIPAQTDWLGMASWVLLTAALIAVLTLTEPSIFESGFLGLTLAGLSLVSAHQTSVRQYRLLSPLMIALALLCGTFVGGADMIVKLLIICEITRQLMDVLRARLNLAPQS